jgi:hypothetical protein
MADILVRTRKRNAAATTVVAPAVARQAAGLLVANVAAQVLTQTISVTLLVASVGVAVRVKPSRLVMCRAKCPVERVILLDVVVRQVQLQHPVPIANRAHKASAAALEYPVRAVKVLLRVMSLALAETKSAVDVVAEPVKVSHLLAMVCQAPCRVARRVRRATIVAARERHSAHRPLAHHLRRSLISDVPATT